MRAGKLLVTVIFLGLFLFVGSPQAAPLVDQIPVQGRLTDAGGNPLNGNFTVNFRIYDVPDGGALICENLNKTVNVSNGLFNSTLDLCAVAGAMTGLQLYLGVQVGADPEMTPRQPVYPVPFAYTLRPGAIVKGADTQVFVPGIAFIKDRSTDTTQWDLLDGTARITSGTAVVGTRHIRIPITIPNVLYGQPVRVTSVTVYYKCENGAASFISETELYKQTSADASVSIVNNTVNRTSNTATSYTLTTDAANNTFTLNDGLVLRLGLFFNNEINFIQIGGVRVTLDTNY